MDLRVFFYRKFVVGHSRRTVDSEMFRKLTKS